MQEFPPFRRGPIFCSIHHIAVEKDQQPEMKSIDERLSTFRGDSLVAFTLLGLQPCSYYNKITDHFSTLGQ